MSSADQALSLLYLAGCLVLVVSALAVRRIPLGQGIKMALAWVVIFLVLLAAFAFKDDILGSEEDVPVVRDATVAGDET